MRRKKEEKNAMTFFPCSTCGKNLTVAEMANGNRCTGCILEAKGRRAPPLTKPVKKAGLTWSDDGKPLKLDAGFLEVNGKRYGYIVNAGDHFKPETEITNPDEVVIFHSEAPDLCTEEGKEIFLTMIERKIITSPNKDNG